MRYSYYVCLAAGIFYLLSFHYFKNYRYALAEGDPAGYYLWLPSTLLYNDVANPVKTLEVRRKVFNHPQKDMAALGLNRPEGVTEAVYMNKYTMGMAFMYAPFFATAHVLAPLLGFEQDGFSPIYRYLIFINAVIFAFLGLLVLRKVLLLYFSDRIAAWTLAIVGLGTNLFFFAAWNTGMSHAASFMLFALLMFFSEKWYAQQQWKHAAATGLVYGMITLIRPSDAISIFIPLFWGVVSFGTLLDRFRLLARKWSHVLTLVFCAFLVGFPQLLYWKIHTGKFLYYSYGNEGFDFSKPHLIEGIFGYENGWLTYTPVMYLALAGIAWLFKKRNNYLLPVLLALPVQLYVIYSYWCWQWTNGFGARPMIQFYALLSIPMAGALTYAFARKWLRWPVGAFAVFCIALNIFQAWQFNEGLLWSEMGNRRFFFETLGKTTLSSNDLLYFDGAPGQPADTAQLRFVKNLYFNDFEDSTSASYTRADRHAGQFGFRFNQAQQFSPGLAVEPVGPELKPGRWIKVSIWCMRQHAGIDLYSMSSLVTYIGQKGKELFYCGVRLDNKPGAEGNLWSGKQNVWTQVVYFVPVPERITAEDLLKVYVWNPTPNEIFIDDLRVDLYE